MLSRYYQLVGSLLLVSDSVGILFSWFFAYFLRFYTKILPITKGIPPFSRYFGFSIFVLFIWISVFSYFKMYGPGKIMRRTAEFWKTVLAHSVATMSLFALNYFLFTFDPSNIALGDYDFKFSRIFMLLFIALSGVYLVFSRLLLRNFLRNLRRRGVYAEKVLMIGAGKTARGIYKNLRRVPEMGAKVVGVLTISGAGEFAEAVPVIGKFADVDSIIQDHEINRVIIALEQKEAGCQAMILEKLKNSFVDVHIVPDLQEYVTLGCTVESFGELPMLALNSPPMTQLDKILKRFLDILGSVIGLILFFPLFLIIGFLVKITSKGPIFYGQERMGLDGNTFTCWKFRSMRVDAENRTGAIWAKKNDDRCTFIGSILRRTSLDEIPQFLNVLKGEMSIVGPRPERPEFVQKFRSELPTYMLRHKMKAGITGWAQINGWRGNTSLTKRLENDLYYIQNWSLWLDIKIILLTPFVGFVNKNAY